MGKRTGSHFAVLLVASAALLSFTGDIRAAEPFKDFTFRTVKPPKPGAKKLITIQIGIKKPEQSPADAFIGPRQQIVAPSKQAKLDWFWADISPDLSAKAPGRFQDALNILSKAPAGQAVQTPRLTGFRQIAKAHGTDILLATIGKGISPALVLAMIQTESSGKVSASSSAGASGLMQLMPATAERFGVSDRTDPKQNIKGGVAYLEVLLKLFDGDPILALAAYNAGENAVKKHGGVPPFAETRAYVPKVIAAFQVARALCMTPPELFSDGCVFDLKDTP